MPSVILFHKPFRVLCQFTDPSGRKTLSDYISVPRVYTIGRLDYDSEGLLVLTDDGGLQHRLADPQGAVPKTYLAQVEGVPSEKSLQRLREGVLLKDGRTLPISAQTIAPPPLWDRDPPIRRRQNIPTTWLRLVLREGRNRQVRRMTAAVGHPTLRLIRIRIGPYELQGLSSGQWRKAEPEKI